MSLFFSVSKRGLIVLSLSSLSDGGDDPEVMGAMDDVCSQLEKFYAAPAALVSAFDSLLPLVSGQTAEDVRAALKTRGKGEETADGVDKLRAVLNDLDALQRIIDQAAAPRPAAPAPPSFGDAPPDETADAAATSSDEKKDAEEGQEGEAKASEGEEGENAEEEEEDEEGAFGWMQRGNEWHHALITAEGYVDSDAFPTDAGAPEFIVNKRSKAAKFSFQNMD